MITPSSSSDLSFRTIAWVQKNVAVAATASPRSREQVTMLDQCLKVKDQNERKERAFRFKFWSRQRLITRGLILV